MSEFKTGDKVQVWHSGLQRKVGAVYKRNDNDGGHVVTLETGGDRWVMNSQVEAAPDHYADYPGGADQYTADVATLTEAGMLGGIVKEASSGFLEDDMPVHNWEAESGIGAGANILDALAVLAFEFEEPVDEDDDDANGVIHCAMREIQHLRNSVLVHEMHTKTIARALSRFMPWSQARLGGDK